MKSKRPSANPIADQSQLDTLPAMRDLNKLDNLIRDYRSETTSDAPPELRQRILARLDNSLPDCPLALAFTAIISAAALAAIFAIFITSSAFSLPQESPPPFQSEVPSSSWLSAP